MPNWCIGTLRVRGTKENLTNFVLEGLSPVTDIGQELEPLKMDDYGCIECERCWIKGTHRGFVVDSNVYFDVLKDEEETTIALDTEFAWCISAEELLNSCKKYGVDMRIYAFERGMQFNQIIEIIDGKITKDEEVEFDDYDWDCICPNIGG